jgi:hypothetical protein
MNSINLRRSLGMLLMAGLVASGCDNPVDEDDHEDIVPAGVSIRSGSTELARAIIVGQVAIPTGSITVAVGAQTPELTIVFLNDLGNAVTLTDEYHIRVMPAASSRVTWEFTEGGPGNTGRLTGVSAGDTSVGFSLFHGPVGGGHVTAGFNIPVSVTGGSATAQ